MAEESSNNLGKYGEDLAKNILLEKGYRIIERNYRYGHGEIDIICKDGEYLVFVEVKTKSNLEYGEPEYMVTYNKQKQVRKIAEAYLYENEITDTDCRFDVIGILVKNNEPPTINHIENAF